MCDRETKDFVYFLTNKMQVKFSSNLHALEYSTQKYD